jgi:hypothetical protein
MGLWIRSSEYEKRRRAWWVLSAKTAAIGLESCLTGYRRSELDRAHSLTLLTADEVKNERKEERVSPSKYSWCNLFFIEACK